MKNTQFILTSLFALISGATIRSLWFSGNDNYKIFIPFILIILLIKIIIYEAHNK